MSRLTRRRLLLTGLPLAAALAGCAETQPTPATESETTQTPEGSPPTTTTATENGSSTTDASTTDTSTTDSSTPTATATTDEPSLDLRETNAVAVAVEARDGAYRFDVTLIHDDDGEEGYANWWQVETLDGEQLGRRELLHAHGTREFTRSETVEIPSGTTCVVVRGHDQTHGYGGQAMLVTLETGATKAVRQRSEKQSFVDATCP